jgi:hypothetical protein
VQIAGLIFYIIDYEDKHFRALDPKKMLKDNTALTASFRHYRPADRYTLNVADKNFPGLTGTCMMSLR